MRSEWVSKFMDLRLYHKVIRELLEVGSVSYVHLQGWGEPLLHPSLMDMIREVQGRVDFGLTTNGLLLSEHYAGKLISAGVKVIAVTFAGAYPSTHNAIRVGCDFNTIVNNVKGLIKIKYRLRSDVRVIASYIMLSANIHELPDFIGLSHDLGIEEVVIDNLSYVVSRGMSMWKTFAEPAERASKVYERTINTVMERAKELGIKVFTYSLSCWELTECPERPTETIFINVNGDASPCVFLNLPIKGDEIPPCFMGGCFKIKKVIFGNVSNSGIMDIWNSKDYEEFRSRFVRRRLQGFTGEYNINLTPPSPCITCYRLYGI